MALAIYVYWSKKADFITQYYYIFVHNFTLETYTINTMNKAIFLDKDGTLIKDIPYNSNPSLMRLLPHVETLKVLQDAGYKLIVVSNQSGIAKGYFPENAIKNVRLKLQELLRQHTIQLDDFYYCPHFLEGIIKDYSHVCVCRKPLPGLLFQAALNHNIDLSQSWMIGDILHDVEAGNRASCKTILIDNGNETEWNLSDIRRPNYLVASMHEAVQVIFTHYIKQELWERIQP